jgi:prepilin-type N-terminal cleavage/methylation domain-containing protein
MTSARRADALALRAQSASPPTAAGRRREAGFSLLEVLGAIAILGIWFAIISEIAMLGLRNEGRSHRAMLASLVADEVLAEMEIAMLSGQWPEVSSDEQERDGYTIRTNVQPYELELPEPETTRSSRRRDGKGGGPFQRLGGNSANAESPLLSVKIEVLWFEGNGEDSVTRETFAVDLSQAAQALAGLAALNGESDGGSDGRDDDDAGFDRDVGSADEARR